MPSNIVTLEFEVFKHGVVNRALVFQGKEFKNNRIEVACLSFGVSNVVEGYEVYLNKNDCAI